MPDSVLSKKLSAKFCNSIVDTCSDNVLFNIYRCILLIGELQHLDGFIRRSIRRGYCASDLDIVVIIDQADEKLFRG